MEKVLLPKLKIQIRRKVFIFYDLGGIGKIQLTVKFARKHQNTFNIIF